MKKLTGILIALLALCLILSVPAFATDATDETTQETTTTTPEALTITAQNLAFENEVHILFDLYVGDAASDALEYGMIFWAEEKSNDGAYIMPNVGDGDDVVKGKDSYDDSYWHPTYGQIAVRVFDHSVAAKKMADMVYAQGYIQKADGTYIYGDVKAYSVQTYAGNKFGINPGYEQDTDGKLLDMVKTMLEFGSASQKYFNYRTDDLANAIFDWTMEGLEYTANADGKTCSVSGVSKTFSGALNIPKYALDGDCAGMKVTGINASVFAANGNITSVTIPYGVKTIADKAFYNCGSLIEIKLPSSISSIGSSAFQKCSKLARVYISDLASWCNISFKAGASNPLYMGGDLYINYEKVDGELEIPDGVKTISGYAFYKFEKMTSITIPSSVKNIGSYAFDSCTGLTSIELPNSVQSIGSKAFGNCSKLESINIPSSVTSISGSVFSGCTNLTEITVDAANAVYHAAGNCVINTKTHTLIAGCANSTIPDDGSVTSIGSSAFNGCTGLTNIVIPSKVTSIGASAFVGCSNLTSIAIPNSVTGIGSSAFQKCSKLTSIEIPDGVTKIDMYTFSECKNLASITIPASVTSIGQKALNGCLALKSIYYYGTAAEWANISKTDGWDTGTGEYSLIYLPKKGLMVYYEDFDSYNEDVSDKNAVATKLGWTILNKGDYSVANDNDASYAIENNRLKITTNYSAEKEDVLYDSYVLIANSEYMASAGRGDYTIQYDVEYTSDTKSSQYINLLSNFKDINNFNSVLFRVSGIADNEVCCNEVWYDNDVKGSDYDADGTGARSAVYKITDGEVRNNSTAMLNRSFTVRIQVSKDEGIRVYAKDNNREGADFVCISKADKSANGWPYWNSIDAYAICLRARIGIEGYIDNIAIWTGLDDMPTDHSTMAYETAIAGN